MNWLGRKQMKLPSFEGAREELGFNPEMELIEGIGHTVGWMKAAYNS